VVRHARRQHGVAAGDEAFGQLFELTWGVGESVKEHDGAFGALARCYQARARQRVDRVSVAVDEGGEARQASS
jgi:hypothetical protein